MCSAGSANLSPPISSFLGASRVLVSRHDTVGCEDPPQGCCATALHGPLHETRGLFHVMTKLIVLPKEGTTHSCFPQQLFLWVLQRFPDSQLDALVSCTVEDSGRGIWC
jgi:hypothetical protein